MLVCLSTSGESANIIKAMEMAEKIGMICITMLGRGGGKAANYGSINLIVPSDNSQRIQEVHLHLVHVLCHLIEDHLFKRMKHTIPVEASQKTFKKRTNGKHILTGLHSIN